MPQLVSRKPHRVTIPLHPFIVPHICYLKPRASIRGHAASSSDATRASVHPRCSIIVLYDKEILSSLSAISHRDRLHSLPPRIFIPTTSRAPSLHAYMRPAPMATARARHAMITSGVHRLHLPLLHPALVGANSTLPALPLRSPICRCAQSLYSATYTSLWARARPDSAYTLRFLCCLLLRRWSFSADLRVCFVRGIIRSFSRCISHLLCSFCPPLSCSTTAGFRPLLCSLARMYDVLYALSGDLLSSPLPSSCLSTDRLLLIRRSMPSGQYPPARL